MKNEIMNDQELDDLFTFEITEMLPEIPHCHLFRHHGLTSYSMDVAVAIPANMTFSSYVVGSDTVNEVGHLCGATSDSMLVIDINLINQSGASPSKKFFRFTNLLNNQAPVCDVKVYVRVITNGTPKGKVFIRTKDADDYGN